MVIAVLISILLLFCPGLSNAVIPEAHTVCASCHTGKVPSAIKGEINEICMGCHPPHPGRDHPVNVVQEKISGKLPLDKEKRITCITCHEPHGKKTVGKLLRMEINTLCIACHKS
ncbi:MAG: cytochrome c3 family protein [Nitrospirae bacterium]|nr:cytochrome c3 family protein [Nitrospirota bacterium]